MYRTVSAYGLLTNATSELFLTLSDHFFLHHIVSVPASCCSSSDLAKNSCGFFHLVFGEKNLAVLQRVCVLPSPFPRRAASSVHVCLHVVQHVSQCVLNDSAPAHVTHLAGKTHARHKRFAMIRRFSALTHRLELQVLRRMFKMWPKIDRYLKKENFYFQKWKTKVKKAEHRLYSLCNSCKGRLQESRGLQRGFRRQHLDLLHL